MSTLKTTELYPARWIKSAPNFASTSHLCTWSLQNLMERVFPGKVPHRKNGSTGQLFWLRNLFNTKGCRADFECYLATKFASPQHWGIPIEQFQASSDRQRWSFSPEIPMRCLSAIRNELWWMIFAIQFIKWIWLASNDLFHQNALGFIQVHTHPDANLSGKIVLW